MNGNDKRVKVAWSDDLSFNSEEEREKELALAELAEIETPEKPSYSDEDLNKLVEYVKRMTTLHRFSNDWNEQCTTTIQQFFMESKCLILIIYYHEETLTASLSVPEVPVRDMTYFLRDVDFIFSVENFHEEVTFGTIVKNAEETLLKILETVYAPSLIAETRWPNSVKNEFYLQLQTFLLKLTDANGKKMGLTIMYVPREELNLSVEASGGNKELVKRYENVVFYWIQQIQSFLKDDVMPVVHNELPCPNDKLNFLKHRYENLCAIQYQLASPNVRHISDVLQTVHSSYVQQFKDIRSRVDSSMAETASNIEYLQIIKQTCIDTADVTDLDRLLPYIMKILHMFRYIWINSPYYNTTDKISNLCHYLSNQVIITCRTSVDLNSLFNGNTRTAIEQLRKCIDCCMTYRETYDEISEVHNHIEPQSWILNTELIFNYVDSFQHRCLDMLEICNTMIIFGRIDEKQNIDKPHFGGTNRRKFDKVIDKIEALFKESLNKIQSAKDIILEVQAESWHGIMQDFRSTISYIETLVENLMNEIYKYVNNAEEAIQVLCSTRIYAKRKSLQNLFKEKTMQVWSIFENDIQIVKEDIIDDRNRYPAGFSPYLGQVHMLRMKKNHLIYLNQKMDSAIWMMKSNNSANVQKQYAELIKTIDSTINGILESWMATFEDKMAIGLERTLICQSRNDTNLIECNFDRMIVRLYDELFNVERMNLEFPPSFTKILSTVKSTKLLYENVLSIVIGYNRIQLSLSDDEKQLFEPFKNICFQKIESGISELTWTSENLENYIEDCFDEIKTVENILSNYKRSNCAILKLFEDICDLSIVQFNGTVVYQYSELKSEITAQLTAAVENLLKIYAEVSKLIGSIYEELEEHIDDIYKKWLNYMKHLDSLMEYALVLSVRNSLKNIHSIIYGQGVINPRAFLNVRSSIADTKIVLTPTQEEIFNVFINIFQDVLSVIKHFPRLCRKFSIPIEQKSFRDAVESDVECQKYQEYILRDVQITLNMTNEHLKIWNAHDQLWLISEDEFIQEYLKTAPTKKDFDKDIMKYTDLLNEIQTYSVDLQIKFIALDNSDLKAFIVKRCMEWQQEFQSALKNCVFKDINELYGYIKTNTDLVARPSSLIELQEAMDLYDKLCSEIASHGDKIGDIEEKIKLLSE